MSIRAFLLVSLAVIASTSSTFAQSDLFRDLRSAHQNPFPILTADLDHDGYLDVVTKEPTMIVLMGHGDGSFTEGFNSFPQFLSAMVLHDLNGDGELDLAGTQSVAHKAVIYLGNGDGSFTLLTEYGTAKRPTDLSFADLDEDGIADLIVGAFDSIRVTVRFGAGDGTFPSGTQIGALGNHPSEVEAADLNEDGHVDIVTANFQTETVGVFLGNGDGSFAEPVLYSTEKEGFGVEALRLADVDEDGHTDVLVTTSGVTLWWGDGTGVLGTPQHITTNPTPESIRIADVDEDGALDLILAHSGSPALGILLADGVRSFAAPRMFGSGTSAGDVAVADFNGDGDLDLLAGHLVSDDLVTVLGNGDGTFGPHHPTMGSPHEIVLDDFDGDGRLDMASSSEFADVISVVLAAPGGGVDGAQMRAAVSYPTGQDPLDIVSGDFTGDGAPDLAVVNSGFGQNRVQLFVNNGDGSFAAPTNHPVGSNVTRLVADTMNADAHLDLVVVSATDQLHVLLGNGDGTFTGGLDYSTWFAPVDAVTGDFNGDLITDVATNHNATTTEVQIWLGNGDGSLAAPLDIALGNFFVGGNLGAADIDADGDLDLLGANGGGLALWVLRGNGDGSFGAIEGHTHPAQDALDLALGDVDDDGDIDAVVANEYRFFDKGSFNLYLNDGTGTFAPPVEVSSGLRPTGIALGDLNADGLTDVGLAVEGSGYVTIFTNQTGPWDKLRGGLAGTLGIPRQEALGTNAGGDSFSFRLTDALPGSGAYWVLGVSLLNAPFKGGTMVPAVDLFVANIPINAQGTAQISGVVPVVPAGIEIWYQFWIPDAAGPVGFAASNAMHGVIFD